MCKLPSISRVKQWADARLSDAGCHSEEMDVAVFLLRVMMSASMDGGRLAAIQRSFEPIDDDGTLRMEVRRSDVDDLLNEVLRLRAATVVEESERVEVVPQVEYVPPTVDAMSVIVTANPEALESDVVR